MNVSLHFRWLGIAGVEFGAGDQILAIDPYFTRVQFRYLLFGRPRPNRALTIETLPRCDTILVTHSHWDHLMDVPDAAQHTGAVVMGSPNTCRLLRVLGVPEGQIREVGVGDRLERGVFRVTVLAALHVRTPIDGRINAPLPPDLNPPLRLTDYRMDVCYSFLIEVGSHRLLCGASHDPKHAVPADVAFTGVNARRADDEMLLNVVRPRVLVAIHWDSLFSPLSRPIRPMLAPPRLAIPPFRRFDPHAFARRVEAIAPETRVLIPEIFRSYAVSEL
jgi:L-ascorbate metabolism protein UlaG (beta-lactamase superfamily)